MLETTCQPSGAVTLSWDPQTKNVSAKLQMVGFTPGSSHAMHIHQGSCASQGDVLVPFPDVTANDGGAIDTTDTSSQPSAAGLAAGGIALSSAAAADEPELRPDEAADVPGAVLVDIEDAATGEVKILVGEREVSFTDKALVAKVLRAAR